MKYPDQLYLVQLAKMDLQNHEDASEAWMQDEGIWRAKDAKNDPPGTQYTLVRVCRNPER